MLMGCLKVHDFYEGLTALLVRKNTPPANWQPARLEEISEEMILEQYFQPLPAEMELGFPKSLDS
jgi:hypothetical protein